MNTDSPSWYRAYELEVIPGRGLPLSVHAQGFKHAAVVLIAAALAAQRRVILWNVPNIADTRAMCEIIAGAGGQAIRCQGALIIDSMGVKDSYLPVELTAPFHGPLYFVPALLAITGRARLIESGGCHIGIDGSRPVNHVFEVLEEFGAKVSTDRGWDVRSDGLRGTTIDVRRWSTHRRRLEGPLLSGVTKTALLAGAFCASGTTTIRSPYLREEGRVLLDFLRVAGSTIRQSREWIDISSIGRSQEPCAYRVMPDPTEIMTLIAASILSKIPARIGIWQPDRIERGLRPEIELLRSAGLRLHLDESSISLSPPYRLSGFQVEASHTSIYSDNQPLIAAIATVGTSASRITDRVWDSRFRYATELAPLGLRMTTKKGSGMVLPSKGVDGPVCVTVSDLRGAAAALVLACGRSERTLIRGAHHLERGYEAVLSKLQSAGHVFRVANMPSA